MPEPKPPGIRDYADAYRHGRATPSAVTEACIAAIRASDQEDPPLRAVITLLDEAKATAEAATERLANGAPLSLLDGVPIVVKDNIDISGAPTTHGLPLELPIPDADAGCISRLRDAGCVIVGKANLHQLGAGTSGINPHMGTPRNPIDPSRWCGGSSSGSACAVGAGLVPMAIGTDAGGSIRSPAAFVGAVGLKPTFGRISRTGMSVLCDTLDHIGPITTTCADAAIAFAAIAGVESDDDETWDQPPLEADFLASIGRPPEGLRIGFARRVLDHHSVEPEVARAVLGAASALTDAGCQVVDIDVPDLDEARILGLILLGAEGPSGLEPLLMPNVGKLALDLQVLLALGDTFTARDYLKAQRARNRFRAEWRALFSELDAVVMPTAGMPAGKIYGDALATGEIDEVSSAKAISCTFPSNLTGYPALSVPCGRVSGLPVSAQIITPPWQEARALLLGTVIERAELFTWKRPIRYFADRILQ